MAVSSPGSALATLRKVCLPTEHGGWGLLLEPMLLGMLLAPTRGGAWLCAAGLLAFLSRRPAMLALDGQRRERRTPRTMVAMAAALFLGTATLVTLALALSHAGHRVLPPLALGVLLALVFVHHDAARQTRSLVGQASGAAAMATMGPAILVAGGWSLAPALGTWLLLTVRAAVSIVHVRAQVRRLHGLPASFRASLWLHAVATTCVAIAASHHLVPWLAVLAFILMLVRAWHGPRCAPTSAHALGWAELRLGLAVVALLAAGYAWNL